MATSSSLLDAFLGTFEGAISVLLTLFAGYIIARQGYLDHGTVKRLSKLSSSVFLPCLIIFQMGPELTTLNLVRLWIIPLWGLVSTIIALFIGWIGQVLLGLPHWSIIAAGCPNSNSLPLLLIQSLQFTGILEKLSPGEPIKETLDRAKSLILLNAVVQETLTFQLAPLILKLDKKDGNDERSSLVPRSQLASESRTHGLPAIIQDTERVGLLHQCEHPSYSVSGDSSEYSQALSPIADQPDIHLHPSLTPAQRCIKGVYSCMSTPLIGTIIALILGVSSSCRILIVSHIIVSTDCTIVTPRFS